MGLLRTGWDYIPSHKGWCLGSRCHTWDLLSVQSTRSGGAPQAPSVVVLYRFLPSCPSETQGEAGTGLGVKKTTWSQAGDWKPLPIPAYRIIFPRDEGGSLGWLCHCFLSRAWTVWQDLGFS